MTARSGASHSDRNSIMPNVNRIIFILLWFLFVANVSEALFAPILAVYITNSILGATIATIGFSVAIYSVTKSIAQLIFAKKLDHKRSEWSSFCFLVAGSIMGSAYAFALVFMSTVPQLYFLSALNGVGGAALMAAYYSIFAHHTDRSQEGFEWSLYSVFGLTISTAIGASVGGLAIEQYGFSNTFVAAGCLQIFATILIFFLYPNLNLRKS
jgi:MFS family permease